MLPSVKSCSSPLSDETTRRHALRKVSFCSII
jgi:hypothetical protein